MDSEHRLLTDSAPTAAGFGTRLTRRPAVVHLRATVDRFMQRLGNQFAAAITYFLVLALIPTLMFAFAALGFVLDVVKPEWVDMITELIQEVVPGQDRLVAMLQNFLDNWQTVGIIGVISAFYTAQGFIGNLKDAIRAQLRSEMGDKPEENLLVRIVNNIVMLLGILVGAAVTIALTVIGTSLQSTIVSWLNLPGWVTPVLTITPIVITLAMSWLIFMFIFSLIPTEPIPRRTKMLGSLAGAIALTLLLNVATLLIDLFSASPTSALFGPVIAVMLSMNIFARIIVLVAAWMGTADDEPIFSTVVSGADPKPASRVSTASTTGGNLAALATAAGIVALTILGFKRFEERQERQHRPEGHRIS